MGIGHGADGEDSESVEVARDRARIPMPKDLRGGRRWTLARIQDCLTGAEALSRPVGLETLRAMATVLLADAAQRLPEPTPTIHRPIPLLAAPDRGTPSTPAGPWPSWRHLYGFEERWPALYGLMHSGDLSNPDDLRADLDSLVDSDFLTLDTLDFASWLAAVEAFLETIPTGAAVWTVRSDGCEGWVDLLHSEDDIRDQLGRHSIVEHFPVKGHTGFLGLDTWHVRQHEMSIRHRTDPAFDLAAEEPDPEWRSNPTPDPDLVSLWAWHRLAIALDEHGPAYIAYLAADGGALKFEDTFESTHQGPVESVDAFCFAVGMRDGWWLETEGLLNQHGLVPLVRIDTRVMWELYEKLGWRMARDHLGQLHLFQPPHHHGPAPTVRAALSQVREIPGGEFYDPGGPPPF